MANENVLERPSEGQVEQANGESQGSTNEQTSDNGQSAQVDKNISALQSKYDKRLADYQRQVAENQQALQQYQQGYNTLQARLNEMEEAGAGSDYEKLQIQLKRSLERVAQQDAYIAQQQQAQEAANARNNALQKMADKYGIDIDALDSATKKVTDYDDAVEIAIKLRDKKKGGEAQRDSERREANRPDLGGGGVVTSSSRWDDQYEDAMRRKDTQVIMRLNRERDEAAKRK